MIKREDIYAGLLISSSQKEEEFIQKKIWNGIVCPVYRINGVCRKILFEKTSDNVGRDLLYTSPSFLISGEETLIETDPDYVISYVVRMNEILRYFGFPRELEDDTLKVIYKKFLKNNKYIYKHHRDFGLEIFKGQLISTGRYRGITPDQYDDLELITKYNIEPKSSRENPKLIRSRKII